MVKPTGQMIAIEKTPCFLRFPRGGGTPCCGGHMGRHQGQSGGRGREWKTWATAFILVSMEKMGEAGLAGLGLSSLNNFGGLWGTGMSLVVWPLVPE